MNKYLLWLCLLLTVASCKKRDIYSSLKGCNIDEIHDFDYFSVKSRIIYEDGENKFSFVANFRVRKDSAIWVSAGTGTGIEGIRCLIRPDSIFAIDRMGKKYIKKDIGELKEQYGYDIDFNSLQHILLGNVPFRMSKKPKLNKEKEYCMADQLLRPFHFFYYVGNKTKKLEKIEVVDLGSDNTLKIEYSDFDRVDGRVLANELQIALKYTREEYSGDIRVQIKQRNPKFSEKTLKFPFHIPDKYEAR